MIALSHSDTKTTANKVLPQGGQTNKGSTFSLI